MSSAKPSPLGFDRPYYEQFYESRATRVQGPKDVARLATIVTNIIEATHGPIETVLEVGAGTGLWRSWFSTRRPKTRYRSTDISPYACQRFGHERRDITQWRTRKTFDLVVCQSVLPYLSATDASRAIANLAAMSGPFLYLEAVTEKDLEVTSDAATDAIMKGRPAEWYRRRLGRFFTQIGFGLWVRRDADVALWELEHAPD